MKFCNCLLFSALACLPAFGDWIDAADCSKFDVEMVKNGIWDSMHFRTRMNRRDFERYAKVEIAEGKGWQLRPDLLRCSAKLDFIADPSVGFLFFYEKRKAEGATSMLHSVGAHYWREFVPFVYRVVDLKMHDDLVTDSSLRREMEIAARLTNGRPSRNDCDGSVDIPLPMMNDIDVVDGSRFRAPESIVRRLQKIRPFRSVRNGAGHAYSAIVEFQIESTGKVSMARIINSTVDDSLFSQRIVDAAMYMTFPQVDSGCVRTRYTINRKQLCRD